MQQLPEVLSKHRLGSATFYWAFYMASSSMTWPVDTKIYVLNIELCLVSGEWCNL